MSGMDFDPALRSSGIAGGRKPSYEYPRPRPCEVCGLQLTDGARKVHAGDCARVRDTLLQQKRRQAKRLARE